MSDPRWDLASSVEALRRFVAERDWARFHDPKNLAMLAASEAGELVGELRWVENGEADAFARKEPARGRIAAELADVQIAVLLLADRMGVDLAQAVRDKIAVNARNYPPEVVKGSAERPERE